MNFTYYLQMILLIMLATMQHLCSCANLRQTYRVRRALPEDARRLTTVGCIDHQTITRNNNKSLVKSLSVYYNAGEGFYMREDCLDPNATAYGYFRASLNSTGWDTLEVATSNATGTSTTTDDDNRMIMFAAGLIEGLLTADRIEAHYANLMDTLLPKESSALAFKLRNWLKDQISWAQNFSDANPDDPLARNVGYLLAQLDGLATGFNIAATNRTLAEDPFVLRLINAAADVSDILDVLGNTLPDWETMSGQEFANYVRDGGHCTALVRLLPGLEDLLMAHSTWNAYSATMRVYKHYNLRLTNDSSFVGGRQSFPGYPGTLASLDAFYTIDSGRLVLLQTTNSVFNASLFSGLTPHSLLAWQRVRAVNQLATDGAHWAEQFSRCNSGTYNNQYMLVDLQRFQPTVALNNGALTIVEQIPGLVRYSDQTAVLRTGYWPSYNVPFHSDIYQLSGYPEVVKRHGLDYSYQMAPRAKILRRDAVTMATDLVSLGELMRSNRYLSDPFSERDPCKCLCCRGDLYGNGDSAKPFGCYDAKMTSSGLLLSGSHGNNNNSSTSGGSAVWAISGPTRDNGHLPAFRWQAFNNTSHRLLPSVYNFTWALMHDVL